LILAKDEVTPFLFNLLNYTELYKEQTMLKRYPTPRGTAGLG
jgi:hypothetical protein